MNFSRIFEQLPRIEPDKKSIEYDRAGGYKDLLSKL